MIKTSFRKYLILFGIPVVVGALLTLLTIFTGRGALLQMGLSALVGKIGTGIFLFVSLLAFLVFVREKSVVAKRISYFSISLAVVTSMQLVSLYFGPKLAQADIAETQRYCERFADFADEYQKQNGYYPDNLDRYVTPKAVLPLFLHQQRTGKQFPWLAPSASAYTCNYLKSPTENVFATEQQVPINDNYRLSFWDLHTGAKPIAWVFSSETSRWVKHNFS